MAQVRLEFTVEPIVPGRPGPHVHAAIGAVQARGLPVDVGPFSSIAEGDGNVVADALHDLVSAALANGASRLFVQVERVEDDR